MVQSVFLRITVLLLSVAFNIPILIFENYYSRPWFHNTPRSATIHISVPELSHTQYLSLFPLLYHEPSSLWWSPISNVDVDQTNTTELFVNIEGARFYNNSLFTALESYNGWPKPAFDLKYDAFLMTHDEYASVSRTENSPGLAWQVLTRDMPAHIVNLVSASAAECTEVAPKRAGRRRIVRGPAEALRDEKDGVRLVCDEGRRMGGWAPYCEHYNTDMYGGIVGADFATFVAKMICIMVSFGWYIWRRRFSGVGLGDGASCEGKEDKKSKQDDENLFDLIYLFSAVSSLVFDTLGAVGRTIPVAWYLEASSPREVDVIRELYGRVGITAEVIGGSGRGLFGERLRQFVPFVYFIFFGADVIVLGVAMGLASFKQLMGSESRGNKVRVCRGGKYEV